MGHAGFASAGKDIVCASISVLIINTLNAIEKFAGERVEVKTDDGVIECHFPDEVNDKTKLLLDTMLLGLQDIEKNYGARKKKKYFELIIREVD